MSTSTVPRRFLASSLCLILTACSATRNAPPAPSGPESLGRYVLIIQEGPEGQVSHSWQPRSGFNLDPNARAYTANHGDFGGRIIRTGALDDQCELVYRECMDRCESTRMPSEFNHYVSRYGRSRGKRIYCEEKCQEERARCYKYDGQMPVRFTAIDEAVDWVKRHRRELLVGAVVVIAGVTFVVVVAGTGGGALVLAPVVLLVSPNSPADPHVAEVSP
jgi:hypothetical protein